MTEMTNCKKDIEVVPIVPDNISKGNTNNLTDKVTKSKQIGAAKRWAFTLNNYSKSEYEGLLNIFSTDSTIKYIIGKEIGEKGTPHLQGYVEFEERVRPKGYIGNKRIHWECAKAHRYHNVNYCSKEGKYTGNLYPSQPLKLITTETMYDWQKTIYEELMTPPNDRTIYWIFERIGNVGKSAFCKFMVKQHDALMCEGKSTDIFHGMATYHNTYGEYPKHIIIDCPRASLKYINYAAIEKIKNGLIFSGKYEGKQMVFNAPHIIVFANEEPDEEKFSADRWSVWTIYNKKLVEWVEEFDFTTEDL